MPIIRSKTFKRPEPVPVADKPKPVSAREVAEVLEQMRQTHVECADRLLELANRLWAYNSHEDIPF